MGNQVIDLSWINVEAKARKLWERVKARGQEVRTVYGVPTGGCFVAQMLRNWYGVEITENWETADLIVDDLIDSGATLAPFVVSGKPVDVLYRKTCSPPEVAPDAPVVSGWLKFPWEADGSPTDAVVRLLQSIGEDPKREGLLDTPKRVVKALKEMTEGTQQKPEDILSTQFDVACDEVVVVTGLTFTSLCEHHMLPFAGEASVGYLPRDKVVGLSKIPRLLHCFARRLQVQERLTRQIASTLINVLDARGAAVTIRAQHSCMACRGVRAERGEMVTSSMLGEFRTNPTLRAEFFSLCDA